MRARLIPLAAGLLLVSSASAQSPPGAGLTPSDSASTPVRDSVATSSLDARLFASVYAVDQPAAVAVLRVAEASSVPLIVGAAPALGGAALVGGDALDPAVRAGASQAGAFLVVVALKASFRRARPFRAVPGVEARFRAGHPALDPHSFPSGHSALAFATATSVTLSSGEAWVAVPAFAWASSVALARVWHGVHYPLDVALGAAIGTGAALVVHAVAPTVGPLRGSRAVVVPLAVVPF